jgi:hypothetical protein
MKPALQETFRHVKLWKGALRLKVKLLQLPSHQNYKFVNGLSGGKKQYALEPPLNFLALFERVQRGSSKGVTTRWLRPLFAFPQANHCRTYDNQCNSQILSD